MENTSPCLYVVKWRVCRGESRGFKDHYRRSDDPRPVRTEHQSAVDLEWPSGGDWFGSGVSCGVASSRGPLVGAVLLGSAQTRPPLRIRRVSQGTSSMREERRAHRQELPPPEYCLP